MLRARILIPLALVLFLLGAIYLLGHSPYLQDKIVRSVAGRNLRVHDELFADNALHVILCGTGVPLPDPKSAKACTAVIAGETMFLVDTGSGAWNRIALLKLPGARLAGVFLTHFHSDHIGDLGEVNMQSWALGRPAPLKVYGPPGVAQVVQGFSQAYTLDRDYRVAHHGADLMVPANWPMEPHVVELNADPTHFDSRSAQTVLNENGLKITAFAVDHRPVVPAYGYRFDYQGRSVVISGDTVKCANLVANAQGADLLVSEALAAPVIETIGAYAAEQGNARIRRIMSDIQRYHTTPVEAAEEANEAGVKLLVMTHIIPPIQNSFVRWVFMRGVSAVRSQGLELGYDGMMLTLPPNSGAITISSLS